MAGTTIEADDINGELNDMASALTQSLSKDGQTVPTANLPMGGFKLTGLAAGSTNGDSVRYEQLGQTVSTVTGAVATGTTIIPFDDSIPQNTEGNEYMTRSITPKSATSTLIIDVVCHLTNDAAPAVALTAALFQDSTANALAAGFIASPSTTLGGSVVFRHVMTSGTTSSTTFKVRGGASSAGTTTFNGQSGARKFGGRMASSIVIREVL